MSTKTQFSEVRFQDNTTKPRGFMWLNPQYAECVFSAFAEWVQQEDQRLYSDQARDQRLLEKFNAARLLFRKGGER